VALGDRDVLLGDKPQTEGSLGAWHLAVGDYRQAIWSTFLPSGA